MLGRKLEARPTGERRDQTLGDASVLGAYARDGSEARAQGGEARVGLGALPVEVLAAAFAAAELQREGVARPPGGTRRQLRVDEELDADVRQGSTRALRDASLREVEPRSVLERAKGLGVVKHAVGLVMHADARVDLGVTGLRRRRAEDVREIGEHGSQNEGVAGVEAASNPGVPEEVHAATLPRRGETQQRQARPTRGAWRTMPVQSVRYRGDRRTIGPADRREVDGRDAAQGF